jgi:hypothetical protein
LEAVHGIQVPYGPIDRGLPRSRREFERRLNPSVVTTSASERHRLTFTTTLDPPAAARLSESRRGGRRKSAKPSSDRISPSRSFHSWSSAIGSVARWSAE